MRRAIPLLVLCIAVAAVASGSLDLHRVLGDSLSMAVQAMEMDGGAALRLDEEGGV